MIGYARVSTAEQNLEMQIEALRKAGVPPDSIHVEKVSGAAAKRPKLDWAIDSLREGDTLVVWKLDRMARSLSDLINRVEQLRLAGAGFKSLTEQIDTTTPAGRFMFHLFGAVAEFERDLIRERTRAGVRSAAERGVKFGRDPIMSAKQIKKAQALRTKGMSIRKVAKEFGVSHSTIRNWTVGAGRPRRKRK